MPTNSEKLDKLKEEKEEIQHELFEQKLKGVKGQVMAIGDTLHQRMTDVESKNATEFKYLKEGIDDIKELAANTLKQATKTNGRVSELEKDKIRADFAAEQLSETVDDLKSNTKLVRFMHKYPKITIASLLVGYLFTIKEIRDVVFNSASGLIKLIF
jgi:predicted phage tail protein